MRTDRLSFSALCLALLWLPVVACDCGDDPPAGDGGVDAGPGGDGGVDAGPTDCVTVRIIEGAIAGSPYPDGLTGNGDLEVTNSLIRAAFSAVDRVPSVAASGGVLTDLHYLGQSDHLNELSQLGGTSQALTVVYTEMEVTEETADRAVIEVRGHVAPRPQGDGIPVLSPDPGTDLTMVTTYEINCRDPRVRISSTLENGTTESYAIFGGLVPMDVILWGQKSLEPFCPNPGQGIDCTQFDFSDPLATIVRSPYVGSTGSLTGDPATIALYSSTAEQFRGVHSAQVSSIGNFETGIRLLMPGETKVWQRILVIGDDADAASALDIVIDDLAELGRIEASTVTGTVTVPDATISEDVYGRPLVVLAQPPAAGDPLDPALWTPVTMVRVGVDGSFSARVPAGTVHWEVRMPGRTPSRGTGGDATAGGTLELGAIEASPSPVLEVEVTDGAGAGVPARVVVVGTGDTETPSFGSPWGPSPAANTALTDGDGLVSLPIPEGTYDVYATRGMGWSLAREAVTIGAAGATVTLQVQALDVLGDGFLTADFHVHSAASFDSSFPPDDRVLSYIAEGVDAIVSTEHDVIFDYAPALEAVEATLPPTWQGRLRTFVGVESTQFVPWETFPHTIGHYNGFPVQGTPGDWKNGAPLDEYLDPPTLYERLRGLPSPLTQPLVQLNHGRSSTSGSIYLGYFDSCGFDPTAAFDEGSLCWSTTGPMGTRPWDMDAMELFNAKHVGRNLNNMRDWFAILREEPGGRRPIGTANSDSHALALEAEAGYPVTVLRTDTALAALDDAAMVEAVQSGAAGGALGVFVWVEVRNADGSVRSGPSATPIGITGDVLVDVRVAAAPWVPVEELRVRVNGEVVERRSAAAGDWTEPTDPFGTAGVVRFEDTITLTLTGDGFITVDAGVSIPRVADLDGDGRAETIDANGDGVVEAGEASFDTFWAEHPLPFAHIAFRGQPMAFTNPVFVELGGDGTGYAPPGTPLVD